MGEAKFTPGPWHNIDGDIYDNRSDDAPGIPLQRSERGNYRSWGRELSDAEREANAALIAAAPDLYVSLQHAIDIIEKHVPRDALGMNAQGDADVPGGYQEWPLLDEYMHDMKTALAKANPPPPPPSPGNEGGET